MQMKRRDHRGSLAEDIKKWMLHGSGSRKWRNLSVGTAPCTLFCILLFAKLSAIQAYAIAASFLGLAGYAIVLAFRD